MAILGALFGRDIQHITQAFPGVKDCTSEKMQSAIQDWFHMYYADQVPEGEDPCQRIPCAVVSKLYKACFGEYESTATAQGEKGDFMARCQEEVDRQKKKAVQMVMIGGDAWLKPVPWKDRFTFAVVRRDAVVILGRDPDGRITDMACTERTRADGGTYNLVERRTVDPNGWLTIRNKLFFSRDSCSVGTEVPLGQLPKYVGLVPSYTFREPVGSLGLVHLKMPLENIVDGSHDGVSVYAAADRLIHNINHNEWLLNQEFDNGAIRVIASADMIKRKKDGTTELPAGLFVGLDDDPDSVGVTVFSPALRDASFLARKTEYLRNVESVIGIKRGLLSEVEAAQRTAKEVTSSEGDYALTIQDLWDMWDDAAREALKLCDTLGQLYGFCDKAVFDPDKDLTISWGNGVLYDRDKDNAERLRQVEMGLLSPERYLAWYYDLPCETEADLAAVRRDYMPRMEELLQEE